MRKRLVPGFFERESGKSGDSAMSRGKFIEAEL
jgi:hypothetical protein